MPTPPVAVADFKAQFPREFIYGTILSEVIDSDISRALSEATLVFNPDLWVDSTEINLAFLYASAHFLVLNLQATGGVNLQAANYALKSHGSAAVLTKSVGNVSIGYALPQSIVDSPILSGFMRTDFGLRYLQMITPRLVGAGYVVEGFREDASIQGVINTVPEQDLMPTGNFTISADQDKLAYGSVIPHYLFFVMSNMESGARILVARTGTIKALVVKASGNTLNGTTVISLMKNGAIQSLSTTLATGILNAQDGVSTIPVISGDTVSIKVDLTAATSGQLSDITATLVFVG